MSTSCLIILPSAHLSTARASPRNVGTRSCRKAKEGTSHPLSQEKVLADVRSWRSGPSQTTFKVLPILYASPHRPLSHPGKKAWPERTV